MSRGFTEDQIQQVMDGNDIVEIISQYVTLKKSGSQFMGRCPFHNEKTGSLSVSAEKQLYHCFGCGAGGNTITFIMNIENLNFVEAVKYLAQRANIHLPDPDEHDDVQSRKKEIAYRIHKDAAIYYYKNLIKNIEAQKYLYSRGINEKTIKGFALGFASNSYDGLYKFLSSKGYDKVSMVDSGLIVKGKNNENYYDRFRDRIIFPIVSVSGRVVGFGGRLLKKSEKYPKYLNSSESMIFNKGSQLYGLNVAKNKIRDGRIIAVEGYMDVISMHQNGVDNAVASLGTALTTNQGKLLKRYVEEVVLCYDGDEAGIRAMVKGIEVLEDLGLRVKILRLENDLDPDDYMKLHGKESFLNLVNNSLTTVDFKIQLLEEKYDLDKTDQKIRFVKDVTDVFKKIKSPVDREFNIMNFCNKMSLDPSVIYRELGKIDDKVDFIKTESKKSRSENRPKSAFQRAQENLIRCMFSDRNVAEYLKKQFKVSDFDDEILRKAAEYIFTALEEDQRLDTAIFISKLKTKEEIEEATDLLMSDDSIEEVDLDDWVKTVKMFNIKRSISSMQKKMNDFNLNEKELNELYYKIVEKKQELETLQNSGRDIL
ncbi:DNA primase [Alkalibacter mobilis]|uniref:DNA primase n=1 Tax=Alkalibacter mobilis TaxID=2787712 RepID=UPI00189E07E3|nr:DNA primase [Alkalibacter mobilis]MBF7097715.1 DNA primase [Alkalibacter mobilis]